MRIGIADLEQLVATTAGTSARARRRSETGAAQLGAVP